MGYENFDPNDLLIQSFSTKPESNFGPHRIPHGIRVIHLPTGTVVTCDADRSQHKNRHDALTLLWDQVHGKPSYQELAAQVEALKSELKQKDLIHIGFTNKSQIQYVTEDKDEGAFYPNSDHGCYIPIYMLNVHAHRVGSESKIYCTQLEQGKKIAEIRAEAGRKAHFDGYMLGYEHAMSNKEKCEPAVYAAEYHASVLAGKE